MSALESEETVELIYWKIGHKGALIRTLLRLAKMKYVWSCERSEIKAVARVFGASGELNEDFPVKGAPVLRVGDRFLGQTQVIATYILDKCPILAPKDYFDRLHCLQVIANANDVVDQLTIKLSFRVTDVKEYNALYFDDSSRLQHWFALMESAINLTPTHYHFESRLTAADYAVHWALDGFRELFNFDGRDRFGKYAIAKYPSLRALLKELDESEEVKASRKEQTDRFCNWWPADGENGAYGKGHELFQHNTVAFYDH